MAAAADAPTLQPGSGFSAASGIPRFLAAAPLLPPETGSDEERYALPARTPKSMARWSCVPYQSFRGRFALGVAAFHISGIDRVEFILNGGPPASVAAPSRNPRTGADEYWVYLDADAMAPGLAEVRATAYPNEGAPRALTGNDILSPDGEHAMFLYAEPDGQAGPAQLFVSLAGSPSGDGSRDAPFDTISAALANALPGSDIILLDAGAYQERFTGAAMPPPLMPRWTTIRPDDGLTAEEVIISQPARGPYAPQASLLRWQNVTFDFGRIQQYAAPGVLTWFDACIWTDSEGWDNPAAAGTHITAHYYATNTAARDMRAAFPGATLLRGCRAERISGPVFQNSPLILDCAVDTVDGSVREANAVLYELWGSADNIVVNGIQARNLSETQALFLHPTFEADAAATHHVLRDAAFVNIDVEAAPVFDGREEVAYKAGRLRQARNQGGPPFSELVSSFDHVLFRDIMLAGQLLKLRDDISNLAEPQAFRARHVVFENALLHQNTWKTYVQQQPPEGVRFTNCTNPLWRASAPATP